MARPRTVYRGKRKYGWVVTLLVLILVIALVAAVWLFNYLQKFIVYDSSGLRLVLPYMDDYQFGSADPDEPGATPIPGVAADIVVEEKDYTELETGAGEGLEVLRARRIAADNLSADAITSAVSGLAPQSALVLELKTADGFLHYKSALQIADSYAVNGGEDISAALAAAKEAGVWLVAELSTLEDTAMALRYAPAAMKSAGTGAALDMDGQSWLDPYNDITRSYISSLMEELAGLGFDEILLSGLTFPDSEQAAFSQAMTWSPSRSGSIASFALYLRTRAEELGLKISGAIDAGHLRSGSGGQIGQDPEIFFKVFDRVVIATDAYTRTSDVTLLRDVLISDGDERIVPFFSGEAPESGSYIIG